MFVLILVVGLAAGMFDRSAARRWAQRLAGSDRDQRLEALARLARLDHLALIARQSLINALDDDRLPEGAAEARRILTGLVPPVASGRLVDLSAYSIAARAAAILWVVIPLDYAGFSAEVQAQRLSIRRRAAGVLGSLGALKPAMSAPAIDGLERLIRDSDPDVRRAAFQGLKKILDSIITTGMTGWPDPRCRLAISEAFIGADPRLAVEASLFLLRKDYPENMVDVTLGHAWLAFIGLVTSRP
ncbi:MAG: hypothetical protein KJ621_16175 [Proteobacteria bacterium]|nr:hypothetical protein [Pseudomonadota bacterium]MBU1741278.1 hypothetical protein [Pseudomonadota bacterium]